MVMELGRCVVGWMIVLLVATSGWSQETGQESSKEEGTEVVRQAEEAGAAEKGADEAQEVKDEGAKDEEAKDAEAKPFPFDLSADPKKRIRLSLEDEVWFDVGQGIVIANAQIAMSRGPLEMFACPKGTKEHESVLGVKSRAFIVHTALLAIGAKEGNPVNFDPKYEPATGMEIDVFVVWEEDGKQRWVKGQDWVRDTRTKKAMDFPWIFAGSGFWVDPDNGTRHYLAETGELICVSNFSTAMMDLPIESSQANGGLLFEAWEGRIPARGTEVKLVLAPKLPAKKKPKGSDGEGDSKSEAAKPASDEPASEKTATDESGDGESAGDKKSGGDDDAGLPRG